MKRKLIDRCMEWKENNHQFPLYLTGARGVGKTYLALEFAKSFYPLILYLNFETDPSLNEKLRNLSSADMIHELYRYSEKNEKASFLSLPFHDKSTLVEWEQHPEEAPEEVTMTRESILILDEISCTDHIQQILTAVISSRLPIHIIMINSFEYEPAWLRKGSIRVVHYSCFPMDFEEFLQATGNEWYIGVINEHFDHNDPVPEIVHKELMDLYHIYLLVGGLPEAVSDYLVFSNVNHIAEKHRLRYGSMLQDIYTWQNASEALRMRQIAEVLPIQLQKKNKKFQYTYIRKGATRAMFEEAMNALAQTYDVNISHKITDDTQMKLYLYDTGMLASMIRRIPIDGYDPARVREAMLENSVAQALAAKEYELRFWESDSSASVEFLIGKSNLLPIEIFTGASTRSKNLSVLKESFDFDYAVKISSKNFGYSKKIKYVPFYAAYCL